MRKRGERGGLMCSTLSQPARILPEQQCWKRGRRRFTKSAGNTVGPIPSIPSTCIDKIDVIICEDEPYYCLFAGKWTPQKHHSQESVLAKRQEELEKSEGKDGNEAFLKALPPTFLTVDYEGRVIRMDVSVNFLYCLSSHHSGD